MNFHEFKTVFNESLNQDLSPVAKNKKDKKIIMRAKITKKLTKLRVKNQK